MGLRDVANADAPQYAATAKANTTLPEGLPMKLAEWRSQHFSQLEKIAKTRGLNWQTSHLTQEHCGGTKSLEDVKKDWLLDRLVTYELHVWETRNLQPLKKEIAAPRPVKQVKLPADLAHFTGPQVILAGSSWDEHTNATAS